MVYLAKLSDSLTHRMIVPIIIQAACILLMMSTPKVAQSAIFACQSGEDTIYQDRPCKQPSPVKRARKTSHTYPLSIHPSWFIVPEQADERAFCDRGGCECGQIEKKHPGTLAQAVADALFLDGSWHRYDNSLVAWMEAPAASAQGYLLRAQMQEASCDVMISQTILRHYADDVIKILEKRSRIAEESGFDVKEPCLEGITDACTFFEAVTLLSRIQEDAKALHRDRQQILLTNEDP